MAKEKTFKSFDGFTNLYELSKTLRFELKPMGNTQKMLEENQIFQEDKIRKEKYEKLKPYFNELHIDFAREALQNISLTGLGNYFKKFEKFKKITKDTNKNEKNKITKDLKNQEKRLRTEIVKSFDKKAGEWSKNYSDLKKKNIEIFFEKSIFKLLEDRYGGDKETEILNDETGETSSIFSGFKGFTGYFTKFHETRKNFYKDDGTSTALATRIIDQNLKRFCENLQIFKKIKDKLDISKVEKNFGKSMEEVFSLNFYNQCVLQDGIDFYNKILGGETLKNGIKLKGLNEAINKYRQNNKNEKLPFLKRLDKQILSEKEKFIKEIENDKKLLETLKIFHKTAEEKTKILKALFDDFTNNNKNYNLKKIYISKEAFNTISNKWTGKTHDFEKLLYEAMKGDKLTGLKYNKKEDIYKFPNFIACDYIRTALNNNPVEENFWKDCYYKIKRDETNLKEENRRQENKKRLLTGKEEIWQQFLSIFKFEFDSLFEQEIINNKTRKKKWLAIINITKNLINILKRII